MSCSDVLHCIFFYLYIDSLPLLNFKLFTDQLGYVVKKQRLKETLFEFAHSIFKLPHDNVINIDVTLKRFC